MRKIILLFAFALFANIADAQTFTVFDVDTSDYPTIRAKFWAFDENHEQITDLSVSDFEILENGVECEVTDVTCPTKEPEAISSVLVMDVSGSMANGNLDLAKAAAKSWINALPLGKSECALTTFTSMNYLIQDFTTDRDLLLQKTDILTASGGTDYDAAMINPMSGGLLVSKTGKYKKVIILQSDGFPNSEPNTNKIIQGAKAQNAVIYSVTAGYKSPDCMKEMALQTGGQFFESVTTENKAREVYIQILQIAQGAGAEPCVIEWTNNMVCYSDVSVYLTCLPINKVTDLHYASSVIAKLSFSPRFLNFGMVKKGNSKNLTIQAVADMASFQITDIIPSN